MPPQTGRRSPPHPAERQQHPPGRRRPRPVPPPLQPLPPLCWRHRLHAGRRLRLRRRLRAQPGSQQLCARLRAGAQQQALLAAGAPHPAALVGCNPSSGATQTATPRRAAPAAAAMQGWRLPQVRPPRRQHLPALPHPRGQGGGAARPVPLAPCQRQQLVVMVVVLLHRGHVAAAAPAAAVPGAGC
jgi:hypothetical protein